MKIILLQDVKTLGKKGDIIEANDGYARNYILPKIIQNGWCSSHLYLLTQCLLFETILLDMQH